jgi:hypothetical protein
MLIRRKHYLVIGAVASKVGYKPAHTTLIILSQIVRYNRAATCQVAQVRAEEASGQLLSAVVLLHRRELDTVWMLKQHRP